MSSPQVVLGPGSRVTVAPPALPPVAAPAPAPTATVLVPVAGPQGPKGDPGDADDFALSALTDVDAPAEQPGFLARDIDGVVRPHPAADLYSRWHTGDGPPPTFLPGARPGDLYFDQAAGRLYQL